MSLVNVYEVQPGGKTLNIRCVFFNQAAEGRACILVVIYFNFLTFAFPTWRMQSIRCKFVLTLATSRTLNLLMLGSIKIELKSWKTPQKKRRTGSRTKRERPFGLLRKKTWESDWVLTDGADVYLLASYEEFVGTPCGLDVESKSLRKIQEGSQQKTHFPEKNCYYSWDDNDWGLFFWTFSETKKQTNGEMIGANLLQNAKVNGGTVRCVSLVGHGG